MLKRAIVAVAIAIAVAGVPTALWWARGGNSSSQNSNTLEELFEQEDSIRQQMMDADAAYERGDYFAAERLLEPVAEEPDAYGQDRAQLRLGEYAEGRGYFSKAAKWYRLAAEAGNPTAQLKLGYMYWSGKGVPRDYILAYMWANLAAAEGVDGAADLRDNMVRDMSGDHIAEAERMARELFEGQP